jgi:preprotein translocase subunit SecG
MGDKKPSKKLIAITVILFVYMVVYIAMIVTCIVKCESTGKANSVSSSVDVVEQQDTAKQEENVAGNIAIAIVAISLGAILMVEYLSRSEDKRLLQEEERRKTH